MNDQPPASQRPRPPSGGNGAPRSRPRSAQVSQSRESRFIGYLVLGFGVLAVLAVLILAFGRNEDTSGEAKQAQKPASASEIRADLQAPGTAAPAEAPKANSDLFFERDAKFDADKMEGDWQTVIGRYTAVLQIRKNVYQLIMASSDPKVPRLYSSGTFKVAEDIILLNPRMDWPAPAAPAGRTVSYKKLTRAPFPVIARFDGGKMLWQNTPQSEKRVSGPYTSPLFMSEDVKLATWQPLK